MSAELLSVDEIRSVIAKVKSGKGAGPSSVMVDILKASDRERAKWVTDVCNAVVRDGRIPVILKNNWMVPVYKGK